MTGTDWSYRDAAADRAERKRAAVLRGDVDEVRRINDERRAEQAHRADQAFKNDPDAYRRPTPADKLDRSEGGHKVTGNPAAAPGLTWLQLEAEINAAVSRGDVAAATAFRAECVRRDRENSVRRDALGMPPAPAGRRDIELDPDSRRLYGNPFSDIPKDQDR